MDITIGEKIKQLRKEKKLTLKEIAEETDLSISFLSQVERMKSSLTLESLKKISEVLQVTPSYFFATSTDQTQPTIIRGIDGDSDLMVNQFIYGFGSQLVSADGKTVAINNEKAKAALIFYRDMLGKHAQPTWREDTGLEVMSHFRDQEVAFEIQGIWGVTDIQKNGSPFKVGIIDLKDIGLCAEVGPMMLALPAGIDSNAREEAFQFIRYLISIPAQEKIMIGEHSPEHDRYYPFRTPIRIDMANSPIFQSHPEYMLFIKGFENPSIDVPVPEWQTVKEEVYEPGLNRVMRGEMTIEDFLSEVETTGNKILNGQYPH